MIRRPPGSTLFTYATLSRSGGQDLGPVEGPDALHPHRPEAEQRRPDQEGDPDGEGEGDQPPAEHAAAAHPGRDRKSTRLNSSHVNISYAVFWLQYKNVL